MNRSFDTAFQLMKAAEASPRITSQGGTLTYRTPTGKLFVWTSYSRRFARVRKLGNPKEAGKSFAEPTRPSWTMGEWSKIATGYRREMRTLIASDLHFEFHKDEGESFVASMPDADVLVCAGDLANAALVEKGLRLLCEKFPEVVYIPGNHEFYGSSIGVVRRRLEHLDRGIENLHYLDNKTVEIGGLRFAGTTMWFREKPNIGRLHRYINDFHHIADATHKVYEENRKAVDFLEAEVNDQTIVVTHHLPSDFCVDETYEGSAINCFFVCDMDELICEKQPPLWIHGHTHSSVDTKLDKTRILCNPFGYAGREINAGYLDNLLLDL